jgi:16S rRNA processing protein RimM
MTSVPDGYVLLGTLGRTFQLEGGLRFYALGDAEEAAIRELGRVFIEGFGERTLARVRPVGSQLVVYFVGVGDPQRAQALVNADVYAAKEALPETPAHYLDLLLDLPVIVDGEPLGEVIEVIPAGSDIGQDLLVVEAGAREVLIPLQADYVSVTEAGITLTDPPEGLLELNAG